MKSGHDQRTGTRRSKRKGKQTERRGEKERNSGRRLERMLLGDRGKERERSGEVGQGRAGALPAYV